MATDDMTLIPHSLTNSVPDTELYTTEFLPVTNSSRSPRTLIASPATTNRFSPNNRICS